jgi:hypothetical protein
MESAAWITSCWKMRQKTIELSEEEQRLFSASCEPHPVRGLS